MSRYLVIVESPTKAKTLQRYLGGDYTVRATVGHVKDLPKGRLGVDLSGSFEPEYEVLRGKGKVLQELMKQARLAEGVFLATDPDREGEAIAWHVAEEIGLEGRALRARFHEITPRGIQEALRKAGPLDRSRYDAQQARRILDRIVGYQVSPLLWRGIKKGLSAGRVQSVAVRLIVERERAIRAFVPEAYWVVEVELEAEKPPPFRARLVKIDGRKAERIDADTARTICEELRASRFSVRAVDTRERLRSPPPPFVTSKLQQEAFNRLKFPAKKTMRLAQQLYEGVELGPAGQVSLITYMRTDSPRLSPEAVEAARRFIGEKFGADALPPSPRAYQGKPGAQDAHEAIRPNAVELTPERVKPHLDRDLFRLYELIWKRFVACQMAAARYEDTTAEIEAGRALLRAKGSTLRAAGWLAVHGAKVQGPMAGEKDDEAAGSTSPLPPLAPGMELRRREVIPEEKFTEPPPRYTEATLVKELEENGIGRPSTYASILGTILDREYVAKEGVHLLPTALGEHVNDVLVQSFPEIFEPGFTAAVEEELDRVASGEIDWVQVLRRFYEPFAKKLGSARRQIGGTARSTESEERCERCGGSMILRWGKSGPFLACTAYPACKGSRDVAAKKPAALPASARAAAAPAAAAVVEVDGTVGAAAAGTCPRCGSPMVERRGKFGPFRACTAYPACKTAEPLSTGVACPSCKEGRVAEKRSRMGRTFFGCNRYPACSFTMRERPVAEACPACAAPFVVRRFSKRDGAVLACVAADCTWARVALEAPED